MSTQSELNCDLYGELLRDSSTLSGWASGAIFASLTTLTHLHELLHPRSYVKGGKLFVEAGEKRVVRLPACTTLSLQADGAVRSLLGAGASTNYELAHAIRTHGGQLSHIGPDNLVGVAISALVSAAQTRADRRAVLQFAGLTPGAPTQPCPALYLIEAQVRRAGFGRL